MNEYTQDDSSDSTFSAVTGFITDLAQIGLTAYRQSNPPAGYVYNANGQLQSLPVSQNNILWIAGLILGAVIIIKVL